MTATPNGFVGTPLTRRESLEIKNGAQVRIVTGAGVVYQGVAKTNGIAADSYLLFVNGKAFGTLQHDVYLVDDSEVIDPPRRVVAKDELLELVRELSAPNEGVQPTVVGINELISTILGFDPAQYSQFTKQIGKSRSAWQNQFLSVTQVRKDLDALVASGDLRKVTGGAMHYPTEDDKYVSIFRIKTGWVTAAAYERSRQRYAARKSEHADTVLREKARQIVADRHADEVEQVLAELSKR